MSTAIMKCWQNLLIRRAVIGHPERVCGAASEKE